jgi:hypothetical protein
MNIDFRADLHCHSTYSDGSLSPLELLQLAKANGLKGLSITDHDTIEAYASAIPAAQEVGVELISGVEFSAMHNEASVHILGYAFDLSNQPLQAFCQRHKQRRENRNQAILDKLAALGMPVSKDDIEECLSILLPHEKCTIGRPHIAQVLVKKGFVETVTEAFGKYIGEGRPCYARGETFSVEETISVIHNANGVAIIAHPHLIKDSGIVIKLLGMNFDGLEGYYAMFSLSQQERWLKIAKNKNWLITGGSDFHGAVKPMIPLGCSWIGEDTFRYLQELYQKNNA